MDELETLVDRWLTLPDVAERLDVTVGQVRRMVQDQQLIGVRRGERKIFCVPEDLLGPQGLRPELPGTVTVLVDAGFDVEGVLRWLFTPDESITGGSPIGALQAGHKTEVRRRAQALAL